MGTHWLKADASFPAPRVPLPWAAAIMVVLVLPLGFYLGRWNLPLWVCFIVWAQYFALGANLATWRIIIPSLSFGIVFGALWCSSAVALMSYLTLHMGPINGTYAAYALTCLFWIPLLVYGLQWTPAFNTGTLSVFNGLSLLLAVYFTATAPSVGPMDNPYYVVWWSCLWTVLNGFIGWTFGWLTVFLTFPHAPSANLETELT